MPIGGDTGKVMKALTTGKPTSILEGIDAANTVVDGAGGAVNLGSQLVSPTPTP